MKSFLLLFISFCNNCKRYLCSLRANGRENGVDCFVKLRHSVINIMAGANTKGLLVFLPLLPLLFRVSFIFGTGFLSKCFSIHVCETKKEDLCLIRHTLGLVSCMTIKSQLLSSCDSSLPFFSLLNSSPLFSELEGWGVIFKNILSGNLWLRRARVTWRQGKVLRFHLEVMSSFMSFPPPQTHRPTVSNLYIG